MYITEQYINNLVEFSMPKSIGLYTAGGVGLAGGALSGTGIYYIQKKLMKRKLDKINNKLSDYNLSDMDKIKLEREKSTIEGQLKRFDSGETLAKYAGVGAISGLGVGIAARHGYNKFMPIMINKKHISSIEDIFKSSDNIDEIFKSLDKYGKNNEMIETVADIDVRSNMIKVVEGLKDKYKDDKNMMDKINKYVTFGTLDPEDLIKVGITKMVNKAGSIF